MSKKTLHITVTHALPQLKIFLKEIGNSSAIHLLKSIAHLNPESLLAVFSMVIHALTSQCSCGLAKKQSEK
jgi:hypothetical protein